MTAWWPTLTMLHGTDQLASSTGRISMTLWWSPMRRLIRTGWIICWWLDYPFLAWTNLMWMDGLKTNLGPHSFSDVPPSGPFGNELYQNYFFFSSLDLSKVRTYNTKWHCASFYGSKIVMNLLICSDSFLWFTVMLLHVSFIIVIIVLFSFSFIFRLLYSFFFIFVLIIYSFNF